MKLATLVHQGGQLVAAVDDKRSVFWPIGELFPGMADGQDMVAAITRLATLPPRMLPQFGGHPLSDATLKAPILSPPRNILCVGKNYREHAREFGSSGYDVGSTSAEAMPEHPIIFTKPWTCISGPEDDIPLVQGLDQAVDYEAELAVVIGKPGRLIPRDRALQHVFGYTILNDVTARDLQRDHKQWYLGKAIDGFAPMGPWIVTANDLDVSDMRVCCSVNGESRQDANTADLIFDVPMLIATISRGMSLLPGDIIATGTPKGVGIGFKPPKFLKDGDVVEISISGIGTLRNTARHVHVIE
jgi:2-keto-4-pentenoate hydratase/2-oxohepta-3-ene-1,7-dioic acid hydratase in catechol pathway